jgi:hypothetical protein
LHPSGTPPAQRPVVTAPVVSRFGEISPAFAAAFGASVDLGLFLGARNAEARAVAAGARRPRGSTRHRALPTGIPTVRTVPPSRVRAAFDTEPTR